MHDSHKLGINFTHVDAIRGVCEDWFRVRDPERVCVEVNGLRRAYQAIKERKLELLLLRTGECDYTVSGLGQ